MLGGYEAYVAQLEGLRKRTDEGAEYWMARDVRPLLGYADWRNFETAIDRARMACASAGLSSDNHFGVAAKMVKIGSAASRRITDYFLSRLACYLIAMNSDPSKVEVGYAQTYFAIQTRRQEIADALALMEKRFELRDRIKEGNKRLSKAAADAGVPPKSFGIFHDEGYKGLYGGMGRDEIKQYKRIDLKDDLLDVMGPTELAANDFRITQATDKLRRERVTGAQRAYAVHREVGAEVRRTIQKIGGTMPEDLPPEPSLKKLAAKRKRALKNQPKQLGD